MKNVSMYFTFYFFLTVSMYLNTVFVSVTKVQKVSFGKTETIPLPTAQHLCCLLPCPFLVSLLKGPLHCLLWYVGRLHGRTYYKCRF